MLKRALACLALWGAAAGPAQAADMIGAGATFPAPIYARWAEAYRASTGVRVNYQAIGSGGGIKQIKAGTVDFGASDRPLKPEDLAAAGLYQFPTIVGGVVPIINLPGVMPGQVRLSGPVLADIFMGTIRKWNDPRIATLNPRLRLLAIPITVVHRSDGSGTTFLFTSYLAKKSPDWAKRVGASDAVAWPTGIGGKGNDGVSAFVRQTIGSIGYVEHAFAKQNKAVHTLLQNSAGHFPSPDAAAFSAAAASAGWAKSRGNHVLLLDQPGPGAWPISGVSFILIHRNQANKAQGARVLQFFDWAFRAGDASALRLGYVPLPPSVKALMRRQWAAVITAGGRPVHVAR